MVAPLSLDAQNHIGDVPKEYIEAEYLTRDNELDHLPEATHATHASPRYGWIGLWKMVAYLNYGLS